MIKRLSKIIGSIAVIGLIGGCQIQPLHSTSSANRLGTESISSALQSVEISDPKTRLDQLVRNELLFNLNGGASNPSGQPYLLELATTKSVRSVGISDVDFGPRAFFVTIKTNYILKDTRKVAPIAQGSQEGTASYDRVDQEFANVRAERDAEIRAAKAAALRLRHELSIALNEAE